MREQRRKCVAILGFGDLFDKTCEIGFRIGGSVLLSSLI
jgi:hypothetical protein